MRDLTFSLYTSVKDTKSQPFTQSWEDWVDILKEHDIREANGEDITSLESTKDGPCIVLGYIPENQSHKDENVEEIHALGLDIEHCSEDEIIEALATLNDYEYIAYSTHKHGSPLVDGPRIRVILPIKEVVQPDIYPKVWRGLNRLTGFITDEKTKNIGRVFYTPSSWNADVVEFHRNKSDKWISIEDLVSIEEPEKEKGEFVDVEQDLRRLTWTIRNMGKNHKLKEAAQAVIKGDPYANAGKRHQTGLDLTMWIANQFPEDPISEEAIEEFFCTSIDKMQAIDSNAPGMEDLLKGYRGAVGKAKDNLYRKQLDGESSYSEEELQRIADGQNCEVTDLKKRWIIQKGRSYYILDHNADYTPVDVAEARPAAVQFLKRSPVVLFVTSRTGYKRKNIEEIVEDNGTVAEKIVADLTIKKSWFDIEKRVIHEAVRPIRTDLVPTFHQKIDDYFKVMAGVNYEKLCDWLACFPDLDKLLCALYTVGPSSTFKTGLATGLSKLWEAQGSPTPIKSLLKGFNEDLIKMCPLVVGDEGIPKEWNGNPITAELREMVSIKSRPLQRKFKPPALLFGSIRLILCANNEFLLQSEKTVPSPEDLEATAERFLYLKIPEAAKIWKEKHISSTEAKYWCEGGGFAEHCLWLWKNREVKSSSRFWVEGDTKDMHSLLLSGSEFNSWVNYWLVQYLVNPQPIDNICQQSGLVRIDKGEFLVNDQALIDYWDIYNKTRMEASPGKVATALRSVSAKNRIQRRWGNKSRRIRYRNINLHNLFIWAEEQGYGNRAQMMETINRKPEPIPDNVTDISNEEIRKKILARKVGRSRVEKEDDK